MSLERQLNDVAAKNEMHKAIDALGEADRMVIISWHNGDDADEAADIHGFVFPHDLHTLEAAGLLSLGVHTLYGEGYTE
jgi:hypothetical protein